MYVDAACRRASRSRRPGQCRSAASALRPGSALRSLKLLCVLEPSPWAPVDVPSDVSCESISPASLVASSTVSLSTARMKIFAPKLLKTDFQLLLQRRRLQDVDRLRGQQGHAPLLRGQVEKKSPSPSWPGISEAIWLYSSHARSTGRSKLRSAPARDAVQPAAHALHEEVLDQRAEHLRQARGPRRDADQDELALVDDLVVEGRRLGALRDGRRVATRPRAQELAVGLRDRGSRRSQRCRPSARRRARSG